MYDCKLERLEMFVDCFVAINFGIRWEGKVLLRCNLYDHICRVNVCSAHKFCVELFWTLTVFCLRHPIYRIQPITWDAQKTHTHYPHTHIHPDNAKAMHPDFMQKWTEIKAPRHFMVHEMLASYRITINICITCCQLFDQNG